MTRAFLLAVFAALAWAQDFSDIRFETLVKGLTFTEGPAWSKDGYLIFSDTPADRLMKWVPGHNVEVLTNRRARAERQRFRRRGPPLHLRDARAGA